MRETVARGNFSINNYTREDIQASILDERLKCLGDPLLSSENQ